MEPGEVEVLEVARARIKQLESVVREQGEFIQSLKEMIADFVYGDRSSLGRLNGGR